MAQNAGNLKRVRVWEEPNGAFATTHIANLEDFLDLPVINGTIVHDPQIPMIDPGMAHQRLDGHNVKVQGPRFATATLAVPLATLTSRVANDAVAPESASGRLLKILMGGQFLGTGQSTTGGDEANPTVDAATGIRRGATLAFASGSGGRLEAREVKDIAGTTINLKHARSAVAGATAHAAANYFLDARDGSVNTSLQCAIEGWSLKHRYLYRGGIPTGSLRLEQLGPGEIARISTDWKFAAWDRNPAQLVDDPLGRATYLNNRVQANKDSEFRYQINGTTTIGTMIQSPIIEITPNIAYEEHNAPDGINTIVQAVRVPADPSVGPCTVSFVEVNDARWDDWYTAWENDHAVGFWYQIGTSPSGGGVLISIPTCQVVRITPEMVGNVDGIRITCEARLDGDTDLTGLSGDELFLAESALRISQF